MKTSLNKWIGLSLFLYPVLLLTVKGGMNAVFFILLILSAVLFIQQGSSGKKYFDRDALAFAAAMSAGMVAIFLSQAYHGHFVMRTYDSPSRLLLAIPVYLALRTINSRTLSSLQYGLPLGAIAALGIVFTEGPARVVYVGGRATASFIDLIHFGDLALLLGVLSVFSIHWSQKDSLPVIVLKIAGLIAGIYVSIQSGSRGGWIAVPFILVAWVLLQDIKHKAVWLISGFLLAGVAATMSYFLVPIIHTRIDLSLQFLNGNLDHSIVVRLQQWQAVWQLFTQNPLFGVGLENVAPAMEPFVQSGLLGQDAWLEVAGELHSDMMASLARWGVVGLLATLAIYIVPLRIFIRSAKSRSHFQRTAGRMGVCVVVAFIVFGLTVENFNLKMVAAFYALTVAVLLAAATGSNHGDGPQKDGNAAH